MRYALQQTTRAGNICLRCLLRSELVQYGAVLTTPPRLRHLHTSRSKSQSAAAAAAASEDTHSEPHASETKPSPQSTGHTPTWSLAFSNRPAQRSWGSAAQDKAGLAAQEAQPRTREPFRFRGLPRSADSRNSGEHGGLNRPRIRYHKIDSPSESNESGDVRRPDARPSRENGRPQVRYTQDRTDRAFGSRPARPGAENHAAWRGSAGDQASYESRLPRERQNAGREPNTRDWVHVSTSRQSRDNDNWGQFNSPQPAVDGQAERYREISRPKPLLAYDQRQPEISPKKRRQETRDRISTFRERRAPSRRRNYGEEEDLDEEAVERIERHRQRKKEREAQKSAGNAIPVVLPEFISVGNLASALKVRVEAFIDKLTRLGFEEITNDHIVDAETAGLVAAEFGFEPILPQKTSGEDLVPQPEPEDKSFLLNRPPVVTIMGHVDHGKTTLLDWLRSSSVAASEHGGITQHIGAFTVPMQSGRVITFLDTPGHAAFLAMRARGANVTDIVILVVAADDSVKPQTIEAIKHAKDAKVPVIVAISKVDKPEADAQRVKQDLARFGIEVEDIGGDVQAIEVSGKTGQGMENLEEAALALADILDIRAPTDGAVEGWVLDSSSSKAGKTATVLVRRGTLKHGTILVAGATWTRVRTIHDEHGNVLESAGPGTPVVVDGWRAQPNAGDETLQANTEQRAKEAIDFRLSRADVEKMAQDVSAANQARNADAAMEAAAKAAKEKGEVEDADEYIAAQKAREEKSGVPEVPMILRADVAGSAEALDAYIQTIPQNLIRSNILRSQVGQITSSDIDLAQNTGGAIVAFNVDVPGSTAIQAEKAGVQIVQGNVIYKIIEEVKSVMEDRLPPLITSKVLGEAAVLQAFEIGVGGRKKLKIAGCSINNGLMKKGGLVRIMRGRMTNDEFTSDLGAGRKGARKATEGAEEEKQLGERIIYTGHLATVKHHKKDVNEIRKGSECGLSFEGPFEEFEAGDRVQYYEEVKEKRKI